MTSPSGGERLAGRWGSTVVLAPIVLGLFFLQDGLRLRVRARMAEDSQSASVPLPYGTPITVRDGEKAEPDSADVLLAFGRSAADSACQWFDANAQRRVRRPIVLQVVTDEPQVRARVKAERGCGSAHEDAEAMIVIGTVAGFDADSVPSHGFVIVTSGRVGYGSTRWDDAKWINDVLALNRIVPVLQHDD